MATATAPAGTKRCPGYQGLGPNDPQYQEPHELPADLEHFNSNRGAPGGLSTRCRRCGNAYGTDWAKRDRALRAADALPLYSAEREAAMAAAMALPPIPRRKTALEREASAVLAPAAPAAPPATVAVANPPAVAPRYGSDLAVQVDRKGLKGYSIELVAGVRYALPDGATASTDEGQAALELLNNARATERRRRDAERKRAERAAAKAKAGEHSA